MSSKHNKKVARRLYQQGQTSRSISDSLGIPLRTVQRWIKSFEKEKVIVHGEENLADPSIPSVEALPALEAVANAESRAVELTMTSRTAVRLLNLAESAVTAVEQVLTDENSAPASRLRAAQIAGEWLGFKDSGCSIFEKVSNKLELETTLESSQSRGITFTPRMVVSAREREEKAQEARRKMNDKSKAALKAQERLVRMYSSLDDVIFLQSEPDIDWMYFLPVLADSQGLDVALRLATHLVDYSYLVQEEADIFLECYS